jgi:hypothetical protein
MWVSVGQSGNRAAFTTTSVSPANSHSTDCSTLIIRNGTVGQILADVPNGLSLTPPQDKKKC